MSNDRFTTQRASGFDEEVLLLEDLLEKFSMLEACGGKKYVDTTFMDLNFQLNFAIYSLIYIFIASYQPIFFLYLTIEF